MGLRIVALALTAFTIALFYLPGWIIAQRAKRGRAKGGGRKWRKVLFWR